MRPVPRHNINMDEAELTVVLTEILHGHADPGELLSFEREVAAYHGVAHAIAVSSGRAAQGAVMAAMDLPPDSSVVVPAYAFKTVPAVVRGLGFQPSFTPCHTGHFAMDPDRLERYTPANAAAVVVIHPFGQPAPVDRISCFCSKRGIPLIEDSSQSIGASLAGRLVGTFGKAACISLVHGKNMMTFGGGLVLTDDAVLAGRVRRTVASAAPEADSAVRKRAMTGLANWALTTRAGYTGALLGPFLTLNAIDRARLDRMFDEPDVAFDPSSIKPMSAFQAKLGRLQLKRLDLRNAVRRHNAERLLDGLRDAGIPGSSARLPETLPDSICTWNAFPLRVRCPSAVQKALLNKGIDSRPDYMSVYGFKDEWERDGTVFYLPNHPGMTDRDVDWVVQVTADILKRA